MKVQIETPFEYTKHLAALTQRQTEIESALDVITNQAPRQIVFRFTKIWEKIIVIIRERCSERILINQERVEPRFA